MLDRLFVYLLSLGTAGFVGWELSGWAGATAGVALMAAALWAIRRPGMVARAIPASPR